MLTYTRYTGYFWFPNSCLELAVVSFISRTVSFIPSIAMREHKESGHCDGAKD